MLIQFEIESIINITNRGYFVFVKQLYPDQHFQITQKSFLGGVELVEYLDMPRAIDEKGEPRYNIFVLQIKNPEDASKLKQNQIVDLIPGKTE